MVSGEDGPKGQQQLAQGSALGIMLSPMYALQEGKSIVYLHLENAFALLGR